MKTTIYALIISLGFFVNTFVNVGMAQNTTVVAAIKQQPELSIFADLIIQANLTGMLESAGPFTIFAPNNAIFSALPVGTMESLRAYPEVLATIIKYHVVDGYYTTDLITGNIKAFPTLEGSSLAITDSGVGNASVINVNIKASNGVVHVIDNLLVPASVQRAAEPPQESPQPQFTTTTTSPNQNTTTQTSTTQNTNTPAQTNQNSITRTAAENSAAAAIMESNVQINNVRYTIKNVNGSDISGSILVAPLGNRSSIITVALKGLRSGDFYPAQFHVGNCGSGGEMVLPLTAVDGSTGFSTTVTQVPLQNITQGDHYVNVYLSDKDKTIVSCGEIGL